MRVLPVAIRGATLLLILLLTYTAFGISLTEYTFPTSKSQEAYLVGTYNAGGSTLPNMQNSYDVSGDAYYNFYFRSLPFQYQINANGILSKQRAAQNGAPEQGSYDFDLKTIANKYIRNDSKVFGYGDFHLEYAKSIARDAGYKPYLDATVGGGYGRTVDATVLKQAIRMSEDFKRFNVTKSDIPDDALLKLARIIDEEGDYKTMYGPVEYQKYWYNAMEDALKETGSLVGDHLGAMGILRIQEVLAEHKGLRQYGWDARAGLGAVVSDTNGWIKKIDPLFKVSLDWSHPVDISLQFNDNLYSQKIIKQSTPIDLSNMFQIYYELSNRIYWDNRITVIESFATIPNTKNSFDGLFVSQFNFYIENEITFSPSFNLERTDNGVAKPVTNWTLSTSINYRLR